MQDLLYRFVEKATAVVEGLQKECHVSGIWMDLTFCILDNENLSMQLIMMNLLRTLFQIQQFHPNKSPYLEAGPSEGGGNIWQPKKWLDCQS